MYSVQLDSDYMFRHVYLAIFNPDVYKNFTV